MENSETTDPGRKIVGALVGIVLIVILILAAKWTGDKIRSKLAKPAPVTVVEQVPIKTATYSAIPSTGPNDWLYAVAAIMILSGAGLLKLSR